MGNWCNGEWVWNLKWRRNLFGRDCDEEQKLVELISSASLVKEKKGRRIWKFDKDELYTSKKAYALMLSSQRIHDADVCDAIWNQFLLARISFFAWRMFLERLPTKLKLDRGNIEAEGGELICPICKLGVEELNHVLLQCDLVRQVWAKIFFWWDIEARLMGATHTDYRQIISGFTNAKVQEVWSFLFIIIAWHIWGVRNNLIFQKIELSVDKTVESIQCKLFLWLKDR
ncbi:hypothetical protein SLE2022_255810 [Rubroshorea leprosula]